MAFIASSSDKIQFEETQYKSSVSEGTYTKIGGALNNSLNNTLFRVGDIKQSALTEEIYQSIRGDTWVLMKGQDITGSDLATLTGITVLPNMVSVGAHLEQLESGNSVFDFFPNQNKDHNHSDGAWSRLLRVNTFYSVISSEFLNRNTIGDIDSSAGEPELTTSRELLPNGSDRFRPNSYQINHFIKINE